MRTRKSPGVIRYPKQRAEEITKNPIFQKEIANLRRRWKISDAGIKSNGESKRWHRWLDKISDEYLESTSFKQESRALATKQKRATYEEYPHQERKKDEQDLDRKTPINEYRNDLLELRNKLQLSDYWDGFIERYLKFNDISDLHGNNSLIVVRLKENTRERELYIRIWEHTRLEDIKNIWGLVKIHQENIPGFKKTFRDSNPKILERDSYIVYLANNGKKPPEIADEVYKNFVKAGSPDEEEFYTMTEDAVVKVISRRSKKMT